MVLVQAEIIAVEAEINIETPVAIIVREGGLCESSLRRLVELESIALEGESSISLVQKEQRPAAANHQEILEPFVLEVCKQCAGRGIQHADSRGLGDILERSIAAIAVKPVRKTCGLANVNVIEPVVVDVAHRHAIVTVNVDPAGAIQHRAPMVHSAQHLILVRLDLPKSLRCDVEEDGLAGAAQSLLCGPPLEDSPGVVFVGRPPGEPISNTLFAAGISPANQVVAYIDFNGGVPDFFNSGDFKLRCFQGSHRRQVILDFFKKSLATGNQIRSKLSSQDLNPIRRAHRDLPLRNQASRFERRVEKLFQNGNSRWCRLETHSPLIKRPHDFQRILFCDKLVRTRSHQPEQIIKRRLGGIVRCEAKIIQRESGLIAPSPRE